MGKSSVAARETGSVDVAVLESLNADCSDQRSDHRYCDDGIREQIWV